MNWHSGEFQLHAIHTGRGESLFLIFPDSTTMLLDAGDHEPRDVPEDDLVALLPNDSRRAGEWIARYVQRVNPAPDPTWVDYLVVSHLHSDHTGYDDPDGAPRGFAEVIQSLHFRKAIDRDYPNYTDPCPCVDQDIAVFLRSLYGTLQTRDGLAVERFDLGAHDQIHPLHGDVAGFSTFNLCANGRVADEKTGRIENFYRDYPDCQPGFTGKPWINENGMSLGFLVRYGAFSLFLAGDFSDRAVMPEGFERFEIEDRMAPLVPPVSVAKVNHHGHYSMPASLVAALRAKVWFGSVWTKNQFVPPVMERLTDRSLYPGDRLVCPGVLPPVLEEARAAGTPYIADIPPAAYEGGHVVITVPPGGETFTVQYLTAADESMRVTASYEFPSR